MNKKIKISLYALGLVLTALVITNPSPSEFDSYSVSLIREWGAINEACVTRSRVRNNFFYSKYELTDVCHEKWDSFLKKDEFESFVVLAYLGRFKVVWRGYK
ncbi:hypothetical protein [Roseivirga spongicola]|uniref:hypothetical protein n=1 Tax=Roseivirga spongicola TaxID=333140 RepID=UPI002AC905B5|nr:hypothetical protein [Roseivirga spongicola]WPZ08789.1 hypothetical protein T7867_11020 [Roseivirga spongicola]